MSTRSSRAARRRRRRRAQQLTESQKQLFTLTARFHREAKAAEARKREAALNPVPPADPRKLQREIERAQKQERMMRLIAAEHRRLEQQDRRDHAINLLYADEPMTGRAIWSRPPMLP